MVALPHQSLKRRIFGRRPRALRKFFQLLPALVILVPGIEKRGRLRNVDEDRNFQLRAFFKQRIEDGIVGMDAFAVRILQVHAEILEDYQALRAVSYIGGKALRRALAVSGSVDVGVTRIREDDKAVGIAAL